MSEDGTNGERDKGDHRPTLPIPRGSDFSIRGVYRDSTETDTERRERHDEKKASSSFFRNVESAALAAWSAVVVAACTGVVSVAQCTMNKGQVIEARRANEVAMRAAKAAEDSVRLASDAAKGADEQFRVMAELNRAAFKETVDSNQRDQRAWVGVSRIVLGELGVGKPLTATVHVANSGKTFAKGLATTMYLVPTDRQFSSGEDLLKYAQSISTFESGSSISVVPPNGSMVLSLSHPVLVSQSDMSLYTSGTATIFVIGEIRYEDIFGIPRYTRFCASYGVKRAAFQTTPYYNDAS